MLDEVWGHCIYCNSLVPGTEGRGKGAPGVGNQANTASTKSWRCESPGTRQQREMYRSYHHTGFVCHSDNINLFPPLLCTKSNKQNWISSPSLPKLPNGLSMRARILSLSLGIGARYLYQDWTQSVSRIKFFPGFSSFKPGNEARVGIEQD